MRGFLAAVVALSAGCREEKVATFAAAEVALAAEYAGCAAVLQGPTCEVSPDAKLAVWVPGPAPLDPGEPTRFSLENKDLVPEEVTEVDGGRRYRLPVAPGLLVAERPEGGSVARWRLTLTQHTPAAVVAAADGVRRTDPPAAEAKLRASLPGLAGVQRAEAELLLGKVERQLGKLEGAVERLRTAEAALRAAGHLSGATNAAEVAAFVLSDVLYRFTEAEDVLRAYPLQAEIYPEGAARIALYRAYPACGSGDFRRCLRLLDDADQRTERLGMVDLYATAQSQRAGVLRQLGQHAESLKILEPAARALSEALVCTRAMALNNVVLARTEADRPWASVLEATEQAMALAARCGEPEQRALIGLTVAEVALERGRVTEAEAALGALPADLPSGRLRLWSKVLRGRLALLHRAWGEALEAFQASGREAREAGLESLEHGARVGEARALAGMGRVDEAVAAFRAADGLVDDVLGGVPVGSDRDAFVGDRDDGIRHHIALLIDQGRAAEALELSRKSRARALASLRLADRLDGLDDDGRRRWQVAIGSYLQQKAELEVDDWSVTEAERARRLAARPQAEARLRTLLDGAWAAVGREPPIDALPPPTEGEVLLHYRQGVDGWWGFARDAQGVEVKAIALTPEVRADDLAGLLLAPFADAIRRARRVRFVVPGQLATFDLHALAFDGAPLALGRSVVYAVDLPAKSAPVGSGVLVVADPRGDLAGARTSGQAVAKMAGSAARLLAGDEARRPAVLAALGAADLFLYAGHGDFAGDGWASHLRLAGQDELSSGDILMQPRVPRRVVLAGCETGIVGERSVAPGMSLAHAFVVAGAEAVVATSRPVADAESARWVDALHRELAVDGDLVEALHRTARGEHRPLDWAAWRVIVR